MHAFPLVKTGRRVVAALSVAVALLAADQLFAQDAGHDLLRGRVRGPDTVGIKNATVNVLPSNAGATSRYVRTDSIGNWALLIDGSAPAYTVTVTALGMQP